MSSKLNISELQMKPNPDLVKERRNGTVNVEKLKIFMGTLLFDSTSKYNHMIELRDKIMKEIKPIDYNFYNLDRKERFDYTFEKTFQYLEFLKKHNLTDFKERNFLYGPIFATEKQVLTLHTSMVRNSVDLWATEEQKQFWIPKLDKYEVTVTYAQTELGHGTYVRGLETVVTFDKETDEFIINSPTITSYKYWPGSLGVTCNSAIVMARLVLDGVDHGIHGFMVPIRSPETHKPYPNIEVGDIGHKFGFNSQDNGYLAFHNYRIPRFYMFMKFAQVSRQGVFSRSGNPVLLYSSMMLTRAGLCSFAAYSISASLTIAIRYSCVRHQTANPEGIEPPILEYQTQQYRLFSGLATCYALYFTAYNFGKFLDITKSETNNLQNIPKSTLAQLHTLSSSLKAFSLDNALNFAQVARLCCGGHGYSASSGLGQIIMETDAGCTYEGDNIILYLQTARYLLKCAQRNESPHFKFKNEDKIFKSEAYLKFKVLIDKYYELYDQAILDASETLLYFINEKNLSEYEAWNNTSVLLVNASKVYINLFVIMSNIACIAKYIEENGNNCNGLSLVTLFELYLLYGLTNTFGAGLLKHKIVNSVDVKEYEARLFSLLSQIRKDAVLLVDAFDLTDSNLTSTLGCYDGNVYERLLDYARNSDLNRTNPVEQFDKYLKPFVKRHQSKL